VEKYPFQLVGTGQLFLSFEKFFERRLSLFVPAAAKIKK